MAQDNTKDLLLNGFSKPVRDEGMDTERVYEEGHPYAVKVTPDTPPASKKASTSTTTEGPK